MFADIAASQPIRVLSLRYFNPIGADPRCGPGCSCARPTHALGKMIQAHQDGVPFVITGTDWPTRDGSGLRDYVHVWDLAAAHVAAINLGTGTGTTVRELLAAFDRVAGRPVEVREAGRRPGDAAGACSRIDRAKRLLGWRPQYDLAEGISHSLAVGRAPRRHPPRLGVQRRDLVAAPTVRDAMARQPLSPAGFRCVRPHQHFHDRIPPSRYPDRDYPRSHCRSAGKRTT
jgi:UDP-glucose 4-epimerase